MIDKNLLLVAARHTPTALKEPCVWQHQTAESVADLPQDERVFAGDLCVFAASDGTKTAFRYEHYWECEGEKKFDVYAPEVIADLGTVAFTKDGEELEELTYGDTVTVTVTADEGYQVKTITLNGEEIENGAEITVDGDITLIAEFEEAPAPSGTVIFDDNVMFFNDVDNENPERDRPGHWEIEGYIAVDDETFTRGIVGFVDDDTDTEFKTVTKKVTLTLSDDRASVNIKIGDTDYGTHELGTTGYVNGAPVDIEELLGEGVRATGNFSLFPSGSFDDTEENYFCCLVPSL